MMKFIPVLAFAAFVTSAGCARQADVASVPVGSEVEIVKQDGGVVHGTLSGRDERTVKVDVGRTNRTVPREQIADVRVVDKTRPTPAPLPPVAKFREFTLPQGTKLDMRLDTAVASDTSRVEDPVEATLSNDVLVDGITVVPSGSIVRGLLTQVDPSGKVKGRASLAIKFTSITVEGRDERTAIVARSEFLAPSTKGEDTAKIGIPAGAGAAIGAMLGGKKGAAIGAAVGGGGGTAVVLATAGKEIRLERGSALSVSLDRDADVRVPIARTQSSK